MFCFVMLCYVCDVMLCYVNGMEWNGMLCYVCHVMSCYVMVRYVMLC